MSYKTVLALIAITVTAITFTGCAPAYATKASEFPRMYEEQPRSILILPPMNESTDAEAKDYYMTTIEMPFALAGYYTFPVEMVGDIMKQEGVYDTETLYNVPLGKFYEYFGADTVLLTYIKKWDLSYMVIASTLTVSIEAKLLSTKTSEELWKYTATVVVDLSGGDTGGGIAGLIAKVVVAAINSSTADYVQYAHTVNRQMISTLPAGPYSGAYMKDQGVNFIDQTPQDKR